MRILVCEDDPDLCRALSRMLDARGFAVDQAREGEEAVRLGLIEPYDAIVLDLGLPGLDGVSVLKRWRAEGMATPVLVLTARSRWSDKLAGFNAGADDYVTKPFEMEEVVLRLRALVRRSTGRTSTVLACGPITLDTTTDVVAVNGRPIRLTTHEFRILAYLMHHPGRVISRTTLQDHTTDRHTDRMSNVIDVLLSRIRRKLGVDAIQTVRGQGYRLVPPEP
ncbi:MAG: response regulator transcription factor [Azospirillaceae bacterium]